MVEVFKSVKKQLKQSIIAISEEIDILNSVHKMNPKQQKEKLECIRRELGNGERYLKDLELQWAMLRPNEKQYYKPKLLSKRADYEALRKRFFGTEEDVERVYKQDKVDNNDRYRLNDGIASLYDQES